MSVDPTRPLAAVPAPAEPDDDAGRSFGQRRCELGPGPANVEWLRDRVGAPDGPLRGIFWRGGQLVRTSAVGEDGYVPPRDEDDDNGPMTVTPLTRLALSTLVGDG